VAKEPRRTSAKEPRRTGLARVLRKQVVPAETILWRALRNRALGGFKFRRQHPIGQYVVDFACVTSKVAVELDGETHLRRKISDLKRTTFLEAEGWQVLRFWNTEVYDELDSVKEAIYQTCIEQAQSS